MTGSVAILSVGAGDTKLMFDNRNPAETIRAARIVKDMLRRGYALLIEVERDGEKVYQRVHDFDETKAEYIIADFDPIGEDQIDAVRPTLRAMKDDGDEQASGEETGGAPEGAAAAEPPPRRRGRPRRSIPASEARVVAVSRSAGG